MLIQVEGGIIREMTDEELAESGLLDEEEQTVEERLYTLEEAMAILLGVKE